MENFDFDFGRPGLSSRENGSLRRRLREKIHKACSDYLTEQYYRLDESRRRDIIQKRIWGGRTGQRWHQEIEQLYEARGDMLKPRMALVEKLQHLARQGVRRLVEVGTGNGWFLNELSQRMPGDVSLVGLDLDALTIQRASQRYKDNPRLSFYARSLRDYAAGHSLSHTAVVSCFVLEYFSREELTDLCRLLERHKPCVLAFIERVHRDSLEHKASFPIGAFSFSHDYEGMLMDCGFERYFSSIDRDEHHPEFVHCTAVFRIGGDQE